MWKVGKISKYQRLTISLLMMLIGLIWSVSAHAHSSNLAYNDLKPFYIEAARTGDAEAMYQLAQIYMNENDGVVSELAAQRLYFHASEAGHFEAKQRLLLINPQKLIEPPKTEISKPEKNKNTAPKTTEPSTSITIAASVNPAPKDTAYNIEPYPATTSQPPQVDGGALQSNSESNTNPVMAGLDAGVPMDKASQETEMPVGGPPLNAKSDITTLLVFVIIGVVAFICGVYLLCGFNNFLEYPSEIKRHIPDDFNKEAYLLFNPDVEKSGINPFVHYAHFGRHEDRAYRF